MTTQTDLDAAFQAAAQQTGVPVALLKSVAAVESGTNPAQGDSGTPAAITAGGPATGMMQMKRGTAADMGADPSNPVSSIYGAARYLKQGYDATGSWDGAALYYHGGPNQQNWGPKTQAYHAKVAAQAATLVGADGGDVAPADAGSANPFLAMAGDATGAQPAPSNPGTSAPSANPFLAMAQDDKGGGNVGTVDPSAGAGGGGSGAPAGGSVPVVSGSGDQEGPATGGGGLLASLSDPISNALVNGRPIGDTLQDYGAGVASGLATIPETMMKGAGGVVRAVGGTKSADTLDRWADGIRKSINGLAADPNSPEFKSRELGGMVVGSEPLTALKILPEAEGASGLGAALRRYANMGAQGAAAGVATSRGENVGTNAALGAVIAPGAGAVIDKALPAVAKVMDQVAGSKLATALSDAIGGDASAAASKAGIDLPAGATAQKMADGSTVFVDKDGNSLGGVDANGRPRLVVDITPDRPQTIRKGNHPQGAPDPALVDALKARLAQAEAPAPEAAQAAPDQQPPAAAAPSAPPQAATPVETPPADMSQPAPAPMQATNPATAAAASGDQAALAEALRNAGNPTSADSQLPIAANDLGSRGARIGLESNTDLPPEVAQHAQALIADGMPRDQALREAEITYAGAKPTLADVTRNPADQRGKWEGAKQDTPEGQALAQQIANNNGALHNTVQGIVQGYGGAPAEGEVAEGAAHALANDEDALRRGYSERYAEAEAAEGPARVEPDDLYTFLNNPYHSGAINPKARGLVQGLRARLDLFTHNTGAARQRLTPLSAHALEHLRKTAIDAYDEVGSPELRSIIHDWTNLIDKHLTDLGDVGPTYARARHAFAHYAGLYKDPEGLAGLIQRNDRGAFVNADKWRLAEQKFLGGSNDRTAMQVIGRLRDLPDGTGRPVLDRLKARIVQDAYEAATGRRAGNATDMLGNSAFSGKLFLSQLDKVGMPKLQALFTPQELGKLAVVGRAASHVNEAVPGTVNTSGTASALLNALGNVKNAEKTGGVHKLLRMGAHVVGAVTHPGLANVAVEGISHAASAAKSSSARAALAEELRRAADPVVARTAGKAEAKALAEQLRRQAAARALSDRTAPVAAITQERNR